jgi:dTDP-4-dehydrorhamnose 3,5-epimerase
LSQPDRTEPESLQDGHVEGIVFLALAPHADARGWLVELYRDDELPPEVRPVMAFVSETLPGVTRGPHEHVEQTDDFAFIGPGELMLYCWDVRTGSPT